MITEEESLKSACPQTTTSDGFVNLNGNDMNGRRSLSPDVHRVQPSWDFPFEKDDLLLLIGHQLDSLGYQYAVEAIERKSGLTIRNEFAENFKFHVCNGIWPTALNTLPLILTSESSLKKAQLIFYKQIFFELLAEGKTHEALTLLREHIQPSSEDDFHQIQNLASLLLYSGSEDLEERTGWLGTIKGRFKVLSEIQQMADPKIFPEQNRLANMITSLRRQASLDTSLIFESGMNENMNLWSLTPNNKRRTTFSQQIDFFGTINEIWAIDFSPIDDKIVYGVNDGFVVMKNVELMEEICNLALKDPKEDDAAVSIRFSPDGLKLLLATQLGQCIVWCVSEETVLHRFERRKICFENACWIGNDVVVMLQEHDSVKASVNFSEPFDVDEIESCPVDIASHKNSLYICTEDHLFRYDYRGGQRFDKIWSFSVSSMESILSINISADGEQIAIDGPQSVSIVSTSTGNLLNNIMVNEAAKHQIIRSCIVGNFLFRPVCSLSDDNDDSGHIAVFNWNKGMWIENIAGLNGVITSVKWDSKDELLVIISLLDNESTVLFYKLETS